MNCNSTEVLCEIAFTRQIDSRFAYIFNCVRIIQNFVRADAKYEIEGCLTQNFVTL
jgi:hypothetical protein